MTRPVEILASELYEHMIAATDSFEALRDLLKMEQYDGFCSDGAKNAYHALLRLADAAWKIHETLEKQG
jgi:hypothetical protein